MKTTLQGNLGPLTYALLYGMNMGPNAKMVKDLLPGEKANLLEEIRDVVPDPNRWLNSSNDQLRGKKPIDLIGTEEEPFVRDLVRAIKYIGIS